MVSSLISCGISMLPIVYFAGALDSVRPFEWGLMLVHGLFCSGLASVLYAKGIARTNAFAANLVCMSEVVLAPCWSALLFGEVFRWNELFGRGDYRFGDCGQFGIRCLWRWLSGGACQPSK